MKTLEVIGSKDLRGLADEERSYEITVSGNAWSVPGNNSGDNAQGNRLWGSLANGTDTYRITGSITSMDASPLMTVEVDGDTVTQADVMQQSADSSSTTTPSDPDPDPEPTTPTDPEPSDPDPEPTTPTVPQTTQPPQAQAGGTDPLVIGVGLLAAVALAMVVTER